LTQAEAALAELVAVAMTNPEIAGMDAGADSIDDRNCVPGVGHGRTRPRSWRERVDESLPFSNS